MPYEHAETPQGRFPVDASVCSGPGTQPQTRLLNDSRQAPQYQQILSDNTAWPRTRERTTHGDIWSGPDTENENTSEPQYSMNINGARTNAVYADTGEPLCTPCYKSANSIACSITGAETSYLTSGELPVTPLLPLGHANNARSYGIRSGALESSVVSNLLMGDVQYGAENLDSDGTSQSIPHFESVSASSETTWLTSYVADPPHMSVCSCLDHCFDCIAILGERGGTCWTCDGRLAIALGIDLMLDSCQ